MQQETIRPSRRRKTNRSTTQPTSRLDGTAYAYKTIEVFPLKTSRIGRLVTGYWTTAQLLEDENIQTSDELCDRVSLLQDTIVEALEQVSCSSVADVSLKLEVWRLDNEEVESCNATRGERLAVQALDDLKRLITVR